MNLSRKERRERTCSLRAMHAQTRAGLGITGSRLVQVPRESWAQVQRDDSSVLEVWMSTRLLVQLFTAANNVVRVTINRTDVADVTHDGRPIWSEGITWDEMQRVKAEIGRGDRWGVEAFPPDGHVVNVSNMRHMWLLPDAPSWAWTRRR